MDYNTQREKLILPEYGRHIQKMIEAVKGIEDKEKRSEQVRAIVQVMSILNPHLKDMPDYRQKLWDHVYMIAGYDLDIDSPYPAPEPAELAAKPNPIPITRTPIKASCYGRNIENMIDLVANHEDDEVKNEMIRTLAIYMRQQYLIWNKDNVADETIFADMEKLSMGKLKVPEGISLGPISGEFNRPGMTFQKNFKTYGKKGKKNNNKKDR